MADFTALQGPNGEEISTDQLREQLSELRAREGLHVVDIECLRERIDTWTQAWADVVQERDQARAERGAASAALEIVQAQLSEARTVAVELQQKLTRTEDAAARRIDGLESDIAELKRAARNERYQTREAIGDYRSPEWKWGWTDLWEAIREMREKVRGIES